MKRAAFLTVAAALMAGLPDRCRADGWILANSSRLPAFGRVYVPLNTFYTPYPLPQASRWTTRPLTPAYGNDGSGHCCDAPAYPAYSSYPAGSAPASGPAVQHFYSPSYLYRSPAPGEPTNP